MSTKDIRQLVTTPTHAIVSDGIVEASNVGYRPLGDFKANLGLGTSLTSVNVALPLSSGTDALPGLTFDGDTNTGIFRPAADALGLVTNGSEKVRITSAGNVGIGTSTPGAALEVNGVISSRNGTTANLGNGGTATILTLPTISIWLVAANGNLNTFQRVVAIVQNNSAGDVTITNLTAFEISLSSTGSNNVTVTNGTTTQTIKYSAIRLV
jgi:hypothetical protein